MSPTSRLRSSSHNREQWLLPNRWNRPPLRRLLAALSFIFASRVLMALRMKIQVPELVPPLLDSFTYEAVFDDHGASPIQIFDKSGLFTVTGLNDQPLAANDLRTTDEDNALVVDATHNQNFNLLPNDFDPDRHDTLFISRV